MRLYPVQISLKLIILTVTGSESLFNKTYFNVTPCVSFCKTNVYFFKKIEDTGLLFKTK
jgi:hypothetical protein